MSSFELPDLIRGLIERMPKPDTAWPLEKRVLWLRAMADIFMLIYPPDQDGRITVEITEEPLLTPPMKRVCVKCNNVGRVDGGYCDCRMGRDLSLAEREYA